MPRRLLFFYVITFLLAANVNAAPVKKICLSGIVNDEATGKGLPFVTLALLDSLQKIIISGATNEQGEYIFTNISAGNYMLKASCIGYVETQLRLSLTGERDTVRLAAIVLAAQNTQLETVTITAKRPLLERKIDKLIMNVAGSVLAEGNSGTDILRKAPGVTVDHEGNVSLNGQTVAIWMDNRPLNLTGLDLAMILDALDGATVDKVEIIQNPSSKYDAEGVGGIINILTKKNFLKGFNGSVQAAGGYYLERSGYYRLNTGTTLNYRNNWLNTAVNYNIRDYNGFSTTESTSLYGNTRHDTYQFDDFKNVAQTAKVSNDFFLTKNNTIGIVFSGMWTNMNYEPTGESHSEIYKDGVLAEGIISKGTTENKIYQYSGNLNYQHLFGDMTRDLLVNLDYMYYNTQPVLKEENYFHNTPIPQIFTNTSQQKINILSLKADYTCPLGNTGALEVGGKIGQSITDNALLREDYIIPPGSWQENDSLSNTYKYNEQIGALYASVWKQIGAKWSIKAGLRWESTWSQGDWQTANGDTTTTQNYNDFFPSFFADYVLSPKHYFSLSYSKRIQRPSYESLNPFRAYIGPYTYGEGNPSLAPEYTHMFTLSYTFKQLLSVSLFAQRTTQVMVQIMNVDTLTSETSIVWGNFGKTNFSGVSVSLSQIPVTKWWSFNLYIGGYYVESIAPDYSNSKLYGTVQFDNTFLIGKTWTVEASVKAQSKVPQGYFVNYPQYEGWCGVRKMLWDGKASITLYLNDAFNSYGTHVVSDRNGQRIEVQTTKASRLLNFTFTYRFGNSKTRQQRRGSELEENTRLGSGESK